MSLQCRQYHIKQDIHMKWDPLRHPVRYYKINVNEQDKPRGSRASQVLQDGLFPFWGRLCDIQATLAPYAALKQYPYTPFLFLFTLQDKLTLSSTTLPSYLLSTLFFPSSLLYGSPFIHLLNYIQHGSCRLVISLMEHRCSSCHVF